MCNVFTYWEGSKPEYIDTCLQLMEKKYGDNLRIVTPKIVDSLLGDSLHPNWKRIPDVACRSGAIRVALIYLYGGWWIDADTVVLKKTLPLTPNFTYMMFKRRRVLNGYFGSIKHGEAVKWWLDCINHVLEHCFHRQKTWWGLLGTTFATPASILFPSRQIPLGRFVPIDFDNNPSALIESSTNVPTKKDTLCIGLNNSWLQENGKKVLETPACDQGKSNILFHRIMTRARKELDG